MRFKRASCVLAAAVLAAGMLTWSGGVAVAEVVPAGCPDGTVSSEPVSGDDFNPGTEPSPSWTSTPEGTFTSRQNPEGPGDGWQLDTTNVASAKAAMSPSITIPSGRHTVIALTHEYSVGEGGGVWIGIDGDDDDEFWYDIVRFSDAKDGVFEGASGARTSTADMSQFAGRTIRLTLRYEAEDPTTNGWSLHDLALYTCDSDQPSGPATVTSTVGMNEATVAWQLPAWRPESVQGYQVRLVDRDDAARTRTASVPASARQWRFTGLDRGRTYRAQVSTSGGTSTGPQVRTAAVAVTSPLTKNLQYRQLLDIKGSARCGDFGFYHDGVTVHLQRRYTSTGSWVYDQRTEVTDGRWWATGNPTRHTQYRAVFRPGTYLGKLCVGDLTKTVSARVATRVSIGSSTPVYRTVKISGSVLPAHPGMTVRLQRKYSSGVWRTERTTRLDSQSRYRFSFAKSPGRYFYRVMAPADAHHLAGLSVSAYCYVRG